MLSQSETQEIHLLLDQVSHMTINEFEVVDSWAHPHFSSRQASRPLFKLGAADFSWLNKQVRDTVGPLLVHIAWPNLGLSSAATFRVLDAAQAIIRRDQFTEEQYEAFVGGFRQAGIRVPGYREGWAAQAAKQ